MMKKRIVRKSHHAGGAALTHGNDKPQPTDTIRALPIANSTAPSPGPFVVVGLSPKLSRRKGPVPGTLKRYRDSDRALFPRLEQLMQDEKLSATKAARRLADAGQIAGDGAPESLARRLVKEYHAYKRAQ